MSRRALRPSARTAARSAAAAVVVSILGAGVLVPAAADDSPPPLARDDAVAVEALAPEMGGVSFIDVLANDSSPSGEELEICRVRGPERGLSVAEVQRNGDFTIQTPTSGVGFSSDGEVEEGATESLVVLPWENRAGTYEITYWACDTEHLAPATVTVTVRRTPVVTARKTERPGRVRFTNPSSRRAVVLYGGLRQEQPDGRVGLAPGAHDTRRTERRAIRWVAFSPRTGQLIGEGVVRGIRQPGPLAPASSRTAGDGAGLTARMLRVWSRS